MKQFYIHTKRLYLKILAVFMAVALGLGLLYYQQTFLKKNFQNETRIESELQSIQRDLISLQYFVLQAGYFLYFNNDILLEKIKTIKESITKLKNDPVFQNKYFFLTAQKLKIFEQKFNTLQETGK